MNFITWNVKTTKLWAMNILPRHVLLCLIRPGLHATLISATASKYCTLSSLLLSSSYSSTDSTKSKSPQAKITEEKIITILSTSTDLRQKSSKMYQVCHPGSFCLKSRRWWGRSSRTAPWIFAFKGLDRSHWNIHNLKLKCHRRRKKLGRNAVNFSAV